MYFTAIKIHVKFVGEKTGIERWGRYKDKQNKLNFLAPQPLLRPKYYPTWLRWQWSNSLDSEPGFFSCIMHLEKFYILTALKEMTVPRLVMSACTHLVISPTMQRKKSQKAKSVRSLNLSSYRFLLWFSQLTRSLGLKTTLCSINMY